MDEESTSDTFDFNLSYEGDNFTARFVVGKTKAKGGPKESWQAAYKSSNAGEGQSNIENAYTHITLPTIHPVYISVVALALKNIKTQHSVNSMNPPSQYKV